MKCSTCGINLIGQEGFVKFKCPKCSGMDITRCRRCKVSSVKYKCEKCGFEGP